MKKKNKTFRNIPSSLYINLLVIVSFGLLIFIVFNKSLKLSLWGDDWQLFYIINKTYGPGNPFPYVSLKGYADPWGIMKLWLMIVRHFFGYSNYYFFLTSMILRTLGAFASYLFLSKFAKSKLIGLVGSLYVLVGFTGIESTNYTVHMNTYFVVIYIFLALHYLIDSYNNSRKFLLGCLFFTLSLASSPLRSHGLLPFIIIFDIMFGLKIKKMNTNKILLRQVCFIICALIVIKLGFFGYVNFKFINLALIIKMMKNGDFTFISAFVTTLGKALFPDVYTNSVTAVVRIFGYNWFKWVIILGFLIESAVFWLITIITKQRKRNFKIIICILVANFFFTSLIFMKYFRGGELYSNLIHTFIGIFFITYLIWSLYLLFISRNIKISSGWVGIVTGPVLIVTSLMVPLLFNPGRVLDSNHRYLTLSLVGVGITVASLLKIAIENNRRLAIFTTSFIIFILILNVNADRKYFTNLLPTRNPEISNVIWDQFFKSMPQTYPKELLLFYFDDTEDARLSSDAFLYGFPPRVGLKYNIPTYAELPAMTTIYDEVVSAVTDGKAFKRLGYPQEKIGVNQVYAYKIGKKGELTDITNTTRNELIKNINK